MLNLRDMKELVVNVAEHEVALKDVQRQDVERGDSIRWGGFPRSIGGSGGLFFQVLDLVAQCFSIDAEDLRCLGLVAVDAGEDVGYMFHLDLLQGPLKSRLPQGREPHQGRDRCLSGPSQNGSD